MDDIIEDLSKLTICNEEIEVKIILDDILNNIELSLDYINERIENEYDNEIYDQLEYRNMSVSYINSKSVKKRMEIVSKILDDNIIDGNKEKIMDQMLEKIIISPGTKGVCRGNKFNKIVEDYIKNIELVNNEKFIIKFEEKHSLFTMDEIPDWYIFEIKTKKIMIGMNQIDLWSGGAQINRGYKYLNINKKNCKIMCVICKKCKILNKSNKTYKLFNKGFMDDKLCYLNNLDNIIKNYFNI